MSPPQERTNGSRDKSPVELSLAAFAWLAIWRTPTRFSFRRRRHKAEGILVPTLGRAKQGKTLRRSRCVNLVGFPSGPGFVHGSNPLCSLEKADSSRVSCLAYATGTAALEGSSVGLRRIVLVDGDDRIVGYGLGGFDGASVGREPDPETSSNWWIGSFAAAYPSKMRATRFTMETRRVLSACSRV